MFTNVYKTLRILYTRARILVGTKAESWVELTIIEAHWKHKITIFIYLLYFNYSRCIILAKRRYKLSKSLQSRLGARMC